MSTLGGTELGTLRPGESHPWTSSKFTRLSLRWATGVNGGDGTVGVQIGDAAETWYIVPQDNIAVNGEAGRLTNNTDKTISYTLT